MKNNRAIIISTCVFPHGSASANYLQYLAQALIYRGWRVDLISFGLEQNDSEKDYCGIQFHPLKKNKGLLGKFLNKVIDKQILQNIKNCRAKEGDTLIVYSSDRKILDNTLRYAKKKKLKTVACVVEWFPRECYHGKSYDEYLYVFDKVYCQFDLVLPISTYIEKHLKEKMCNCLCVPIMSDSELGSGIIRKEHELTTFLIIANGMIKENIASIYEAINLLSQEEMESVQFVFRGIRETELREKIAQEKQHFFGKSIISIGWLEYDQLIDLYLESDFLLLPRETNQMTLANFPSKVPEVMNYGVIPIVSKVGDYTEYYLSDGVDSVFIYGDSAEICLSAIRKAMSLDDIALQKMSVRARETVKTRFDYRGWSQIIDDRIKSL